MTPRPSRLHRVEEIHQCELPKCSETECLSRNRACTLERHEDGIINHCKHWMHTSRLEGVNNKIKVIKRVAYGFHDLDYFALKVKQAFPGRISSN